MTELVTTLSSRTAAVVQERLRAAVPEMIDAIERGVPDYADPAYQRRLASAVMRAVTEFIDRMPDPSGSAVTVTVTGTGEFRVIGFTAAREGRTLDALQNALRLGARVAWHGLCQAGAGLDLSELRRVGEAIFAYLDELADACARGYADACAQAADEQAAGERARHRQRLLDVILASPPASAEAVASLAAAAHWSLPSQVAVAVLRSVPSALGLPSDVLADWSGSEPCLVLPDPDGPGRASSIDRALNGWPAAIGPTVPLARAAWSLRLARQAMALARRGVVDAAGKPVRCDAHLSTLLLLADEELARVLLDRRLAALERLRPGQRDRLAQTMLAWLQLGENAAEVARRVHVHPQTVRYRLRQIQQLFGDQLRDPGSRFELEIALRIRELLVV